MISEYNWSYVSLLDPTNTDFSYSQLFPNPSVRRLWEGQILKILYLYILG